MRKTVTAARCFGLLLAILCVVAVAQRAWAEEQQTVRIAMCQIVGIDGDREGNFVRMENAVREAKEQGAQIVCLPESIVLGWVNPEAFKRALPIPGKDSDRLCALAKKFEVYLCVGLDEKDGEDLYDSALLIDPAGKILLKHRKHDICPGWMNPPYTAGKDVQVVETEFGTIGVLICADTFHKDICERMGKLRPDLLLIPYGWAAREEQWPKHGENLKKVVGRAAAWSGAPAVGTDLIGQVSSGPNRGLTYGGASVAVAPDGTVLAVAKDRDRDIKVFTLKLPKKKK